MLTLIALIITGSIFVAEVGIFSMMFIEFKVNKHRDIVREEVYDRTLILVKLGLEETSTIVWNESKNDMDIFDKLFGWMI